MTIQKTEMDEAVHLHLPLEPPEPAAGCDVCGALAQRRTRAVRVGDFSKATDCNVEMRHHGIGHGR